MPHLSVANRRIEYLDTARDVSARSGDRVLVLLHAFPLNADMWAPQLAVAPPGWRFVAPHFRGFGGSADDDGAIPGQPGPGAVGAMVDPSLDDYAIDVLALLDHLGVRRAAVAGLSMGGYVAFALLRLAAELVSAIVLADTKAGADTEEARRGRRAAIDLVTRDGPAAVVDQMIPRLLSEPTRQAEPAIERQVRQMAACSTSPGVAAALMRMMGRPDSTPWLAHITQPTLIVVGELDAVTPPADAYAMYESIPGARLAEISSAGHLSSLEQPAAFNAALLHFLETV